MKLIGNASLATLGGARHLHWTAQPVRPGIPATRRWPLGRVFLVAPGLSIAGGTSEVQKNVIGERVLGLPRELIPAPCRHDGAANADLGGTVTRQSGGQAVVEVLAALGVERVFGIVSVHNLPIADAIQRVRSHPVVPGPSRARRGARRGRPRKRTGGLGVAVTSTGPGAANAMGGLFEAAYASSRVLMITGQVESAYVGRGVGFLHEADRQADMLRSVCRTVRTVRSRAELPDVPAFVAADVLRGRPQPGAIEIPIDLQSSEHDDGPVHITPFDAVAPRQNTVDAATALLTAAQRVLIVAGGGVITSGAAAELTALAELLGVPVITSTDGRGSIPEDHPLALGPNTDLSVMDPLFARAEVVLAVGTRFQQATPVQRALTLPGACRFTSTPMQRCSARCTDRL